MKSSRMINSAMIGFLILSAGWIIQKGIIPGWNDTATDFNNYYASSKLLSEGEPIHSFYDNSYFSQRSKEIGGISGAKFAPFPPPTAVIYYPLSFFDLIVAKRIWLILNLLLLIWLPFRIKQIFNTPTLQNAAILGLFFVPISSNLHFGQFYFVCSFLLIESISLLFKKRRTVISSIIIGCLACLKYLPILFLGFVLKDTKNRRKTILISIGTVLAITFLFFLVDPKSYALFFNDFSGHVNGDLSGQGKFAVGFQSIDSLLTNLFEFDPIQNVNPLFDSPKLKSIIKWLFVLVVGLSCFLLVKKEKFSYSSETISICIVGSFVLIPATASYHFLLLILPVYFIFKWTTQNRRLMVSIIIGLLLLGAFTIQTHQIPDIKNWPKLNLLIHFPRLWLLLILFAYLLYTKLTKKIIKNQSK